MCGSLFYNSMFRHGYRLSAVCQSSGLSARAVKFENWHTRLHQDQNFRRNFASRQWSNNTKQQLDMVSDNRSFGGQQKVYEHYSAVLNCRMRFSVYVPDNLERPAPILYHLSGMLCSEQSFIQKTGFQRWASHYGIIVVSPDICPRVTFGVEKNEIEAKGLSYYVNAIKKPWNRNYQMYSYVNEELPSIIQENFNVNKDRQSIMGHSMGGHGALISALKNPGKYRSVSAFAPVCNPSQSPDERYILKCYFGDDSKTMEEWDATCLITNYKGPALNILIHQGWPGQGRWAGIPG
ncbi:S-formylglutathione hydrolase-like isoform X2 [Rhopalosiphum maidis]|uniref:S-formylglutathione hydrolase-like isoform X2 n=1 Tax=Rhopalosiphum maidis TaxID=43146 RepID=UPI000F001037|nr:S-formylglutathione hydrolase-like isoform X2 [Rhopalosiphum maidis]